jgi:hypothetical protein
VTTSIPAVTDLHWLRTQLDRYTYKPGWTWTIDSDPPRRLAPVDYGIRIKFTTPDSRGTGHEIPVMAKFRVPFYLAQERDEGMFADWLARCILEMERHEQREWLRRDGVIYDNPHE